MSENLAMSATKSESGERNGQCALNHAKLSLWLIGIILTLSLGGCVGVSTHYAATAASLEPRLRALEQQRAADDAATAAFRDFVREKLDEINRKLDKKP